ncbi:MAG: 23S rRNA (pseudouridine(1915)-N(3))-methyltransferase RlmH [Candidatus Nanoarchaeia archaeon]|nr:23S rRNA (pseudouridine(1915)-N(3))-methyltransferase RlmH [Candidatus Nanoarchaeia archaeon]MDD5054528.1 23S rRNA (pseudouridine(1915)-N(3))-methyltransferase RlmH [Candidatus Nanoarchaeia archaeon]
MASVKIIAVGKIKEKNIQELINEYEKRLKPFIKLEIIELKDAGVVRESREIMLLSDADTYILDEKGSSHSSISFSELIRRAGNIKFVIGGAEGISKEAKMGAKTISLSSMTFTHEMARLFLIEQVYRAIMIINGRNYHK